MNNAERLFELALENAIDYGVPQQRIAGKIAGIMETEELDDLITSLVLIQTERKKDL